MSPKNVRKKQKVALVLEGGGMRGMFTAGVLDVLLEHGIVNFSHVYGVSAGAINGANYMAGAAGRFCRDVLAFRDRPEFFSLFSYVKTGNVMGKEFLFEDVSNDIDPFPYKNFNNNPVPFTVVATDVTFGTPVYLDVKSLPRDFDAIIASASLPLLSEVCTIEGKRLLDGGTADSIPVERALMDGAEKLVVVSTQDRNYVRPPQDPVTHLIQERYHSYPYYLETLRKRPEHYNAQRQYVFELEAAGKAVVLAPAKPVELATLEQDGENLLRLYIDGARQARAALEQMSTLLA